MVRTVTVVKGDGPTSRTTPPTGVGSPATRRLPVTSVVT